MTMNIKITCMDRTLLNAKREVQCPRPNLIYLNKKIQEKRVLTRRYIMQIYHPCGLAI